jgi:hypothetical protein
LLENDQVSIFGAMYIHQHHGHLPADKLKSLVNIALGLSLLLFYEDRPHQLEYDIIPSQGSKLLAIINVAIL